MILIIMAWSLRKSLSDNGFSVQKFSQKFFLGLPALRGRNPAIGDWLDRRRHRAARNVPPMVRTLLPIWRGCLAAPKSARTSVASRLRAEVVPRQMTDKIEVDEQGLVNVRFTPESRH
jgi:hypothetical protein